jgi:hypothetical protein
LQLKEFVMLKKLILLAITTGLVHKLYRNQKGKEVAVNTYPATP